VTLEPAPAVSKIGRTPREVNRELKAAEPVPRCSIDVEMRSGRSTAVSNLCQPNDSFGLFAHSSGVPSAAKVVVGQAARYIGQQSIQLHGGMGMADELDVGHFFRRLTAFELTPSSRVRGVTTGPIATVKGVIDALEREPRSLPSTTTQGCVRYIVHEPTALTSGIEGTEMADRSRERKRTSWPPDE